MDSLCCKESCISTIEIENVQKARAIFWGKTLAERVNYFLDKLAEMNTDGKLQITGGSVCKRGLKITLGIPKPFYQKYLNSFNEGMIQYGIRRGRGKTLVRQGAKDWLYNYAYFYGDRMPHLQELRLPYGSVKKNIFERYKSEMRDEQHPFLSRSAFMDMWKKEFPYITVKKVCTRKMSSLIYRILVI